MLQETPLFTHKLLYPFTISVQDASNEYHNITVKSIDILRPKQKHYDTLLYSLDGLASDIENTNLFNQLHRQIIQNPDYGQSDAVKVVIEVIKHAPNMDLGTLYKRVEQCIFPLLTCSPAGDSGMTLCRVNEREGKIKATIFLQSKDIANMDTEDAQRIRTTFFFTRYQITMSDYKGELSNISTK